MKDNYMQDPCIRKKGYLEQKSVINLHHHWNNPTWRCLFPSYNGIITKMGDNNYSHHTGSRAAHSRSKRAGDAHDRSMPLNNVHKAEEQLILHARKLDGLDEVRTSSSNSSDEEDN